MDYIFELVMNRDYTTLSESLEKLRRFQESRMGESALPAYRVRTERLYNALPPLFPIAGSFLLIGLVMLALAMKNICQSSSQEVGAGSPVFRRIILDAVTTEYSGSSPLWRLLYSLPC